MTQRIKITKRLDIPLASAPEQSDETGHSLRFAESIPKLHFQKHIGLIASCLTVLMLALGWSAFNLAQAATPQPSLKQVIEEDVPEGEAAKSEAAKKKPPKAPVDRLGRDTPHGSALGYLKSGREGDYERAAKYLDLRRLPITIHSVDATELARQLKIVLDRTLWVDMSLLSEDPKGHAEDGLPSHRDYVGSVELGERKVDILLQRVRLDDGTYVWLIANATVRHIPELYATYGYGPIGEKLSQTLPDFELLGLQIWQWVMVIGLFIISYLVAFLPTWLIGILIRRSKLALAIPLAAFVCGPVRLFVTVLVVRHWVDDIHLSITAGALMRGQTLLIIVATWAAIHIVYLIKEYWKQHLINIDRKHATVLLRPVATAIQVIVVIAAVLVWLDNIGFSVTTLLTGLGIGGIAVALAAQKPIENLIGAITLYMATPIRVGDFCRFGDKLGTVEEIGLRLTRIRTLDKTVITVPNGAFSEMHLENFSGRERFRFAPTLRLRYGTTPDQIRCILVELQRLLRSHPKVDPPPARASFRELGIDAIEIEIRTYIKASGYGEFVGVKQDLYLQIMDIVKAAGSDFAMPSQNLYLGRTPPLDEEAAQAAKSQVADWMEKEEMPLPNLAEEEIEEIKDTLQYPPGVKSKEESD